MTFEEWLLARYTRDELNEESDPDFIGDMYSEYCSEMGIDDSRLLQRM